MRSSAATSWQSVRPRSTRVVLDRSLSLVTRGVGTVRRAGNGPFVHRALQTPKPSAGLDRRPLPHHGSPGGRPETAQPPLRRTMHGDAAPWPPRSRAEFTDAVIGRGSAAPSLPPISAPTREAALNSSASSHRSEPGRGRDARGGSAPRPRAGPSREARSSPTGWVRWAARCPRAVAARAGSGLRRSRGRAVSLTPVGGGSRRASGRRVEKCFVAGCALTLQRSRPSGARHQAARAPAANVEATARLQAPSGAPRRRR